MSGYRNSVYNLTIYNHSLILQHSEIFTCTPSLNKRKKNLKHSYMHTCTITLSPYTLSRIANEALVECYWDIFPIYISCKVHTIDTCQVSLIKATESNILLVAQRMEKSLRHRCYRLTLRDKPFLITTDL